MLLLLVVDEVLEVEDVLLDVVEKDEVEVDVVLVVRVDVELALVDGEVVPEHHDDVERLVVAPLKRSGGASGCAAGGCGGESSCGCGARGACGLGG